MPTAFVSIGLCLTTPLFLCHDESWWARSVHISLLPSLQLLRKTLATNYKDRPIEQLCETKRELEIIEVDLYIRVSLHLCNFLVKV